MSGDCAVGAAAKGDADAGDHAGAVAGQGSHDPGGDADDLVLGVCSVYHTSRISIRIWLMTAAVRPGGAVTGVAAVSATGAHRAVNSAMAAWQCTQSHW